MEPKCDYQKEKYGVLTNPEVLDRFANEDSPWYETPDEKQAAFQKSQENARLLIWIRKQMERRLTKKERLYLQLYFFEGKTYRQTAEITGTNASSVLRGVQRAMRKLKFAAKQDRFLARMKHFRQKP